MTKDIFISYRWHGSASFAAKLRGRLEQAFPGQVFLDEQIAWSNGAPFTVPLPTVECACFSLVDKPTGTPPHPSNGAATFKNSCAGFVTFVVSRSADAQLAAFYPCSPGATVILASSRWRPVKAYACCLEAPTPALISCGSVRRWQCRERSWRSKTVRFQSLNIVRLA